MAFFDENANFYPTPRFVPLTHSEKKEKYKFYRRNGFIPIPPAAYKSSFQSIDYIHNSFNHITKLLNERDADLEDGDYKAVFVWDIGEITTLTSHHIGHCLLRHREMNVGLFSKLINRVLQKAKVEDFLNFPSFMNIEDIIDDGSDFMKRMTYAYSNLERFYNKISNRMRDDGPIINYELVKRCGMRDQAVDLYYAAEQNQRLFRKRWQTVRKNLELVNKRSAESNKKLANVVMCEDPLNFGVCELLISGTSKYIPIENIYLTRDLVSKKSVFERIQKRFGEKCVLVYITSRPEEASIPETLQIPIWEIKAIDSIEYLYDAQRRFFLS